MRQMFIDPQRCIGCRACVEACSECPSHGGYSMIHLDEIARADTVQTVCMHCDEPACASVCPADAIHKDADGVVHTAMTERCIGCTNCVVACPFGVPKHETARDLMMKCDHCYDRTSIGLGPMCATVCPSGALSYGSNEEVATRRGSQPTNEFRFGDQIVRTKVSLLVPRAGLLHIGEPAHPQKTRAELCMEEAIV